MSVYCISIVLDQISAHITRQLSRVFWKGKPIVAFLPNGRFAVLRFCLDRRKRQMRWIRRGNKIFRQEIVPLLVSFHKIWCVSEIAPTRNILTLSAFSPLFSKTSDSFIEKNPLTWSWNFPGFHNVYSVTRIIKISEYLTKYSEIHFEWETYSIFILDRNL